MAVKNLVSGVLAQSITTSTTNILVNIAKNVDASAIQSFFPTPPFYITIMPKAPAVGVANRLDSEILQVTAVGSDQSGNASLTCVRGQRDTTAKAFDAGSIVTVGVYSDDAVFLADSGVSGGSTYIKKLVDKDGNTIIPIMGYMGTVYNATLSSATAGGRADYEFTPDTPVENNKVYAVMFPEPTVNNATVILGDGVVSGSILVPPVSATDSPNYELLTTDMINNTEPLLLMYSGVQWVCLNQKKKVATADLEDKAVKSSKIDWATFKFPIPDYSNGISISNSTNTWEAPKCGVVIAVLVADTTNGYKEVKISVNNQTVATGLWAGAPGGYNFQTRAIVPVATGDVVKFSAKDGGSEAVGRMFYPYKWI